MFQIIKSLSTYHKTVFVRKGDNKSQTYFVRSQLVVTNQMFSHSNITL